LRVALLTLIYQFGNPTIITDDHYNALLNLLMQETQFRQNLEEYVNHLNQKMTEMANDVASTKTKVGVLEKTSSNADLQESFRGLKNSSEIMKQAYDALFLEQLVWKHQLGKTLPEAQHTEKSE
jgi:uncharacterized protein YhaN